jgi:putative pyruvate formate lyase activating enzyme
VNPIETALDACELCPRRCGAARGAGRLGFCKAGAAPEIFRYGRHDGEEPPVSGGRGSGTVFFSRCTLRCLYCQNYPWSQEGEGRVYDAAGLAGVLEALRAQGCHNWNLVSPTPWLPWAIEARERARRTGADLPVVYNTSGFERVETLEALAGWVQVYLTDLRYARPESADEGSGAAGYVTAARAALLEMWRQAGPLVCDGDGVARQGTICRLLVLPGRGDEAVENLAWLAEHVGTEIAVSVMAQYTPAYRAVGREGWGRRPARAEYDRVVEAVETLGFEAGWVQDYELPAPDELVGFKMSPA